jgi:hypothetical protein
MIVMLYTNLWYNEAGILKAHCINFSRNYIVTDSV